ncbi:hypothetical protein Sango_2488200 [Sesamum angolense]|uniref:DUF4218 domain-containing protein n=1 Tax=Sesamum angolense TaxID=2727404 RepID=A0AAE1W3N6_9LAMI|nr:hypothetical protein Sango_2488200 [Sesamum angolense]
MKYRWVYPFERFLCELKKKVKNKAHVEASIVEAYIVEEIGMFTSQYFEPDVQSKRSMSRRNDKCTSSNDGFQVSIFNYPDRASGATKKRFLSGPERHIIETSYLNELYQHHHPADPIIDRLVSTEFNDWFKPHVHPELKLYGQRATKVSLLGSSAEVTSALPTLLTSTTSRLNVTTPAIAYQPEEVVPVPIVAIDNQSYDLHDPNSLQVVLEAAGTSRRQLHENDDENENEHEDSGGDDKTDDEKYEAT